MPSLRFSCALLVLPAIAACTLPFISTPATLAPPPAPANTSPPEALPPAPAPTTGLTSLPPGLPQIPGVVSGMVDMASAPPYLNDPIVTSGVGVPVVVVAFNLDDGTYLWVDTTPTHPEFSLSLPPGRYQLVTYGYGVADVLYVTGGYTGTNPSCGQELLEVLVEPGGRVTGVEIADWNWACGGTAYRPSKPADVPIP